ncbi:MAG: GTPase HflX [Deltaproteobacteria bacterium]|nr:GTPase HflX [Deltaproteobacteria bacterium]
MREIDGAHGLKASQVKRLQATYRRRVKGDELVSPELARHLADLSHELNRQVGVLVDRGGNIERVVVGEPGRLYLPDIGRARAGPTRLRGLRLIRTELRKQGLTREDLADLSKLRLDAVLVLQVDAQGQPKDVEWAHLVPDAIKRSVSPTSQSAASVFALPEDAMATVRDAETEMSRVFAGDAREVARASALLVGIWQSARGMRRRAEESMEELRQLAATAGVKVIGQVLQIRRELDPRTVVGKGKIEELALSALELGADVLIFDRDLTPSQLRAVTDTTDLKVLDRTQLILDIFARRAKSRDGKLQVELAQLKYMLPRLAEKSTALSRLTGGIGGQGPGETKLEIHRRRAKDRIHRLEQEIERLSVQRGIRRKRRAASHVPQVAIVGYTNAGKSTLLNAMTYASVLAEDKLFATLDPTSRRVRFPDEHEIVLTDTVGFIRDLPKDLVNAFKATLEELEESDLILHVIDSSDPLADEKMHAVEKILGELGIDQIPRLVVVNKIDDTPAILVSVLKRATGGVPVSAAKREGLDRLVKRIVEILFAQGEARAAERAAALAEARLDS